MAHQPKPDHLTNPDLLQHRAGNLAMWRLSRRYFAVVAASIFAAILAKPELPKTVLIRGFKLSDIVLCYLIIGVVGLFLAEIGYALQSLTKLRWEFPEFVKRIFVLYTMAGIVILYSLLSAMMR